MILTSVTPASLILVLIFSGSFFHFAHFSNADVLANKKKHPAAKATNNANPNNNDSTDAKNVILKVFQINYTLSSGAIIPA